MRFGVAFDDAFFGEDEPALGDAGFGVELEFDAVESFAGDDDFDDQRGGGGVGVEVILRGAADDGEVGLGLGIERGKGEGLLGARAPVGGKIGSEVAIEQADNRRVKRGLWESLNQRATEEFDVRLNGINLVEKVILLDRESCRPRSHGGFFQDRQHANRIHLWSCVSKAGSLATRLPSRRVPAKDHRPIQFTLRMLKTLPTLFRAAAFLLAAVTFTHAEPIPDDNKVNGFAIGCQAYTFKSFTVFEAIEKTAQAGARVIEFYPGQKLSKEEPDVKWDHNASDETFAKVVAKLAQHKIKAVNYGVVGIPTEEAEARKLFAFAKKLGLYAITTESFEAIETIEKMVKEFDIRVGFHDHPRRPDKPNYRMWDPYFILELTKDRDPRIGACADTGHWQTTGINPLWAVKTLKGRIISSHLKDKEDFGKSHDVPYGTGVGQVGDILAELKAQGFEGNISIEYEYNWETSLPEVTKCVEFVKAWKPKP